MVVVQEIISKFIKCILLVIFIPSISHAIDNDNLALDEGNFYKSIETQIKKIDQFHRIPKDSQQELFNYIQKLCDNKNCVETLEFVPLKKIFFKPKVYSFNVSDKKYVLRFLDINRVVLYRESEINAQIVASKLGISPDIIFYDKNFLVTIMPFIDARPIVSEDLKNNKIIENIGKTLKKLHSSTEKNNFLVPKISTFTINTYETLTKKYISLPDNIKKIYNDFLTGKRLNKQKIVLCHGDLHDGNILIGKNNKIYLIDWTYANLDDYNIDLGWLSIFLKMNNKQIDVFLNSYYDRKPTVEELNYHIYGRQSVSLYWGTKYINMSLMKNHNFKDNFSDSKDIKAFINEVIPIVFPSAVTKEIALKQGISFLKQIILDEKELLK